MINEPDPDIYTTTDPHGVVYHGMAIVETQSPM